MGKEEKGSLPRPGGQEAHEKLPPSNLEIGRGESDTREQTKSGKGGGGHHGKKGWGRRQGQ